MSDTQRTKAALLTLFADNTTGDISPQDLRDFLVTVMETEFYNPGDAFTKPSVAGTLTDQTGRGWKKYSQLMVSQCSFGNILCMDSAGGWRLAQPGNSDATGIFGVAMGAYTAGQSTCTVLMEGIVNQSAFSAVFSGYIGKAVYLAVNGSVSISAIRSIGSAASVTNSGAVLIGWIEGSDDGGKAIGKYRFMPTWAVSETIT